jgi:hypothetical protein
VQRFADLRSTLSHDGFTTDSPGSAVCFAADR